MRGHISNLAPLLSYIFVLRFISGLPHALASSNSSNHILTLKQVIPPRPQKLSQKYALKPYSVPPHNASTVHAPFLPSLSTEFTFNQEVLLRPLQVYQTAISLMYDLAQRPWEAAVLAMTAEHIAEYNVLIMFFNPQRPTAPDQLKVQHCVDALFRAMSIMTDGVLFVQTRCKLVEGGPGGKEIGILSISPIAHDGDSVLQHGDLNHKMVENNPLNDTTPYDRGQVVDPDNFLFVLEYQWFRTAIKPKEISLAVLDALSEAARYGQDARCNELYGVSPRKECTIVIENVGQNTETKLTYRYATRALKLLFDKIVVPEKRFEDVYLRLVYDDRLVGEIRVLSTKSEGRNGTATAKRRGIESLV